MPLLLTSPHTPFGQTMLFELSPSETRLVADAARFAAEHVAPHAADWERERHVPVETFRAAAAAGLAGLLVPEAQGGRGASLTALARVMEELAACSLPFAFMLVVHNNLAGNIARNGTPGQQARYLQEMMAGRRMGAFCLTEPGAGSDAAAITTSARQEDGLWRLDGEKAWVTNGVVADLLSVYAQTDPSLGAKGIICMLVEGDAKGLRREPPYRMLGGHAMGASGLVFDDCRVSDDQMLAPAGRAFHAAMEGIDLARAVVGAMCCGMLRTGLETALAYASERQVFGSTVAEQQGVRWQLADVATDLEASRLLTYQATRALDGGEQATVMAAHAKKFATRAALTGISACMQVLGANGLKDDHPLGQHLVGAKIAQYLDGTTEIQNLVISRALFRKEG